MPIDNTGSMTDLQRIQQMAQGGFARVDTDSGQLVSGGKGFFGRVAAWFRELMNPGEVAAGNSAAMNAFIKAIGDDPNYGPEFANMAAEQLGDRAAAGKKLSGRVINSVMGKLDAAKAMAKKAKGNTNSMNKLVAERFATYDIHGDPNNFGKLWADAASEKGLPIEPSKVNTIKLANDIRKDIIAAGDSGNHVVSMQEAKAIAQQHIEAFTNEKSTLLDFISEHAESPEEKANLQQKALERSDTNNISPSAFIELHRINDKLDADLNSTLTRIANERGMGDMVDVIPTSKLKNSINYSLGGGNTPVTNADIQTRMKEKINKLLDSKEAAVSRLGDLNLPKENEAALRKFIASRAAFANEQSTDILLTSSKLVGNMVEALNTSAPDQLASQLAYQDEISSILAPALKEDAGGEDLYPYIEGGFVMWSQLDAVSNGPEKAQTALNALNSDEGQKLADGLEWMKQNLEDDFLVGVSMRLLNTRSSVMATLAKRTGTDPETLYRNGDADKISSITDLAETLQQFAKEHGATIPTAE